MPKQRYWNGLEWEVLGTDASKVEFLDSEGLYEATDAEGALAEVANAVLSHKALDTTNAHQISNIQGLQTALDNKGRTFTTTLNTTWTGSAAPFTKTQSVSGILATDNPIVDVVMSGTYSTDEARLEAWGNIYRITTANNSITLYAKEKPTVELPIQIKVVR